MRIITALFVSFLLGCGGGDVSSTLNDPKPPPTSSVKSPQDNIAIPDNSISNEYQVLLIGNSHVDSYNLGGLIQTLITHGKPNSEVEVDTVTGIRFLDERIEDGVTLEKIESDQWTHVVLQGQKYSQSQTRTYSTVATEHWIAEVKHKNATPILFPEHPQRGNPEEAQYVHDIHLSIVEKQKSCIAPIGLGWDRLIEASPELILHDSDGNHASFTGSVFTAMIFYQVITGELADSLPHIGALNLPSEVQAQLRQTASLILEQHQACHY